jgi:hypothetical protein
MNAKTPKTNAPATPTPPRLVAPKPSEDGSTHRRTGKIARLPQDLRELLNLMLRDGAPYSSIIQKFAQRGHQLNFDNLSRWHAGGYQDWLHEQAWLEEMRLRLDFATNIVHQSNGALLDAASLRIAVTQMYALLTEFNPVVLKSQIANHPGAYSRILNALCKLTESGIKCERHRLSRPLNRSILPPPSSILPPSSSPTR